jgi:hypothetical protein
LFPTIHSKSGKGGQSRDNGQWSSNVTEDGLDRHAAGGAFEKKSRERDCASEIGFRVVL